MKHSRPIQYLRDLRDFSRLVTQRFAKDRCNQIAASLTFTTLLSIVPLLTIILFVFTAFPMFDQLAEPLQKFILSYFMPETGGKLIARYMEQFAEHATKLTVMGVAMLGVGAMLLMHTIENTFNTIWKVSRPRPLLQRVLVYWAVITLTPLLIGGSLSVTSWLFSFSSGYVTQVSQFQVSQFALELLNYLPALLSTLAFGLLFMVVPNRTVTLRNAFIGGLVSSIAFETMSRVFAAYITNFPTYQMVYGAFSSIPIFLLWIYLSWHVTLLGALITALLPHWRSKAAGRLTAVAQLYYALRMLRMMSDGLRDGTVQTLPGMAGRLQVSFEALEVLLDKMAEMGIVRKLIGYGWVMTRDPRHIQVGELYNVFVFSMPKLHTENEDRAILHWLENVQWQLSVQTDLSLQELFSFPVPPEPELVSEEASTPA